MDCNQAAVHGSDFTFTFHFHALEKEMTIHSSVLSWRIPGTGEPGGLPSVGSHQYRSLLCKLEGTSKKSKLYFSGPHPQTMRVRADISHGPKNSLLTFIKGKEEGEGGC